MMKSSYNPIYYCALLFLMFSAPDISNGQDNHMLSCADVKNGTFYFFGKNSVGRETFIRKGALQKEIIPKDRETVLWEVKWLNDCTYTLKYQSGAESHSAGELKFLSKHIVVTEILQVTEDYMTFRTALDKITNPVVLNDTLWIKQRQSANGKSIINPNADSISVNRINIRDSL